MTESEHFIVTFTGPPARNTMRLDGEGELFFEGDEVTVEGPQAQAAGPPRTVRFMFTLREIERVGLLDGAVVLAIRPAAEPAKTFFLSFYVSSEDDARRLMSLLHAAQPAPPAEADSAAIASFYGRLRRAPVLATPALLAANIGIFVLMVLTGAGLVMPDIEAVIRWGARDNSLIRGGQWWRMASPMFIHIGIIHLLFNMWALKNLGDFVERLYGPVRFALVYAGAGLTGCVLSYILSPDTVAAGASGAIFGIMGALVAFIYRRHQAIPRRVLAGVRASAFSFIGYNLFFGFMIKFIDNWAHLGGLAGGLVLGWLLAPPPRPDHEPERILPAIKKRQKIYIAIATAVMIGLIVLARQATPADLVRKASLEATGALACDDLLKEKMGAGAPHCQSFSLGETIGKNRWRAQARLSDGKTMELILIDRGDQVEVLPRT